MAPLKSHTLRSSREPRCNHESMVGLAPRWLHRCCLGEEGNFLVLRSDCDCGHHHDALEGCGKHASELNAASFISTNKNGLMNATFETFLFVP